MNQHGEWTETTDGKIKTEFEIKWDPNPAY